MKRAYVTVTSHGESDVPGVEALGASLRASGTREPMVVLAGRDVSPRARARLAAQGFWIRDIEPLGGEGRPRRRFEKLRAWELVEYDRVVFLECDALVLRNVDDLFERPELSAAPDLLDPERFDTGVMVLAPSQQTFAKLVDAADGAEGDEGEQGLLNSVFGGWRTGAAARRLPLEYNLCNFLYPFLLCQPGPRGAVGQDARILRYGMQKPWQLAPRLTAASSLWWESYFDARPELDRAFRRRLHAAGDLLFERVAGGLLAGVAAGHEGVRRSVS